MLLGTQRNKDTPPGTENLAIQLMGQQRYAEAYELLVAYVPTGSGAYYNKALCLYWSGNYQAAISQLDQIQHGVDSSRPSMINADRDYTMIKAQQKQTHDHLMAMSELYLAHFPALFGDAVTRLKTDCWLQMENFPQVIATATPIEHKGYKNITEALKIANAANDKRI